VKNAEVWKLDPATVIQVAKSVAVGTIRDQVFKRAGYICEFCGANLTITGGHMHEKNPRGKGGEISMDNSVAICYKCHLGRADSEHGNRRFQTSKLVVE